MGLFDPVWWRNKMCIMEKAVITNGRRKWKAKNRVRVALSTENPPHNHCTMEEPM